MMSRCGFLRTLSERHLLSAAAAYLLIALHGGISLAQTDTTWITDGDGL